MMKNILSNIFKKKNKTDMVKKTIEEILKQPRKTKNIIPLPEQKKRGRKKKEGIGTTIGRA